MKQRAILLAVALQRPNAGVAVRLSVSIIPTDARRMLHNTFIRFIPNPKQTALLDLTDGK